MGNTTNTENWSARERLMHVERLAYWRGWIRRSDLTAKFGISTPQASADISEYLRRNPRALRYDLSRKRYEALPCMRPLFCRGTLDEVRPLFAGMDRVAALDLPERRVEDHITRDLVRAALADESLAIYYYSVHSGTRGWRAIRPHAFAHDGYRWHVRAWCHEASAYKDFVLGRIRRVRQAPTPMTKPPPDEDWNTKVTVRFRAHRALTRVQREAIELDFRMKNGVGSLRIRKALLFYALLYFGLVEATSDQTHRLELLSSNG